MSFMGGLGRLLQGKPVFQAGDDPSQTSTEPTQTKDGKVVPRISIIRSDCNINNGTMELRVHIKNESPVEVFIDNIRIFDNQAEIDRNIKPNETSDFVVYKGPVMQDERRNKCELKYRTTDGDFFVMEHFVVYSYRNDTYVVDSIRPVGPVNDIA